MDFTTFLKTNKDSWYKKAQILDREGAFAKENLLELKQQGAYKALIPKDLGGAGKSYTEMCEFLKDLAKLCPSTSLTLSMHQHLIAVLVFKHLNGDSGATNTLKMVVEKGLVLLSTGGADFLQSNGTAKKVAGGYSITAKKPFCSGSPMANVAVTSCAYIEDGKEWVIHFSLPMNADGITIQNDWDALGMRATGSNTIEFKDVFVPDEKIALKRPRGEWHQVWNVVSTLAFPIFSAPYLGVAEKLMEETIEVFKRRPNQPESSIGRLGQMQNELQSSRLALNSMVANVKDFDVKPNQETAIVALQGKTLLSQYSSTMIRLTGEVLGGFSYLKVSSIERLQRDLQAIEYHPIQKPQQEEIMGRYLLENIL